MRSFFTDILSKPAAKLEDTSNRRVDESDHELQQKSPTVATIFEAILNIDLHDGKEKQKAMKTVSNIGGINSISINMEGKKMTVIGEMDAVEVVLKLRKYWPHTSIYSVISLEKSRKKEERKKEDEKKQMPDLSKGYRYYQAQITRKAKEGWSTSYSQEIEEEHMKVSSEHSEPPSDMTCSEDWGIYGRVVDTAELLERVLTENVSDINNLSIVPVCGPPGIGKTTLIRSVYGNPRVREYFQLQRWFQGSDSLDTEQLRNEFFGELWSKERRNILIVLDDIVEFNLEDLESFAGSGRIVVIVASESFKTSIWNPLKVSRLDDSECWELLMRCAFHETIDAAMFVDVGNRIVSLCNGLPLVVKIIGGVLWHVTDEEKWCDVYEIFSVQLKSMGDAVMAALMVGYYFLSLDQRSRFLICSTFGKGIAFTKRKALELWTRAGLVGSSGGTSSAEFGNEYFDDLRRKSFFESSYLMNRQSRMFVMHNSVYDFCA